jgi:hypothetical protein
MRFKGIESSLDVKRRYEADRRRAMRAGEVSGVRGIEAQHLEPEAIEL